MEVLERVGEDLRPFRELHPEVLGSAPNAYILKSVEAACKRRLSSLYRHPARSGAWVIAADAPGLKHQLDDIRDEWRGGATICGVKSAQDVLLAGRVPVDANVYCDARPWDPVTPMPGVTYYCSSWCSPNLFDRLKDSRVVVWHATQPKGIEELVSRYEPEPMFLGGGCTASLRAINVGYALGHRRFSIYGMDSSYPDDTTHASGKVDPTPRTTIEVLGREFETTFSLALQAQHFLEIAGHFVNQDYGNDPVTFTVHGDGLLQFMWREHEHSTKLPGRRADH